MKKETCEFVRASEVFSGCRKAWDAFCQSEPECTWGSNNRSLVTPDVIITALESCCPEEEEDQPEIETVIARLEGLGQTYVDLEN